MGNTKNEVRFKYKISKISNISFHIFGVLGFWGFGVLGSRFFIG